MESAGGQNRIKGPWVGLLRGAAPAAHGRRDHNRGAEEEKQKKKKKKEIKQGTLRPAS